MKPGLARSYPQHPRSVLLLLAALSLIISLFAFDPKLAREDDNAEFIILARSIVQGRWMQLINQPDSPRSDKFPFGFPLLLAGVEWLAPDNMLAMKALVLALYVLAMPVVYLLLARSGPPLPALAVTLLTLGNPLLLSFSHQVMSEVPYLLASLLTLLCLERAEGPGGRTAALVGGALLAVAATTLRPVGPALFGGAVLWYLLRRQYRRGLLVAGLYLGVLLALHLVGAGAFGPFYVQEAMKVNPLMPESGRLQWTDLPARIFLNLKVYGLSHLSPTLFSLPRMLPAPLIQAGATLLSLPILSLVLIGWGLEAAKRRLIAFYVLAYLGILALWPSIWPQPRYLAPIIPFLLWFLISGLIAATHLIQKWLQHPFRYEALAGTSVVIGASCLIGFLALLTTYERKERYGDYPAYLKGYFEAAEWLGERSPPESVILARRPYILHLISKRKTVLITAPPTAEHVIELIGKYDVNFLLVDNVNIGGVVGWRRYLVEAIQLRREWFEPVYFSPTVPSSVVFKVNKGGVSRSQYPSNP